MSIQNWITLIVIVAIAGYAIYLAITKKWTELRELAYKLMLSAERLYAANQGTKKFEAVFVVLYTYIPLWLRSLITEKMVKVQLQEWYDRAKDFLDDGAIDNT